MTPDIFQKIVEISPEAIFLHDKDFKILLANKAYFEKASAVGITQSEVIGKSYWEVFPKRNGPLKNCGSNIHNPQDHSTKDEFDFDGRSYVSYGYSLEGDDAVSMHVLIDVTHEKVMEKALILETHRLSKSLRDAIAMMANAMQFRDPYTSEHQGRVAKVAVEIAKKLGWNDKKIEGLEMAANIHDVGKMAIPSEILTKPSKLSELEAKMMQEHSEKGYQLLKNIEFSWPIAQIVRQHHERLDGSGYPNGLKGDEILPEAKLLAVADTIEAMSSHRPYRAAVGLIPALAEIKAGLGIKYDREIGLAALDLFEGKKYLEDYFSKLT